MNITSRLAPLYLALAWAALLPGAGCRDRAAAPSVGGDDKPGARDAAESARPAALEQADLGSAEPAHRAGDLYLAGQPSEADIARWARKGYKTVVNLRTQGEMDELEWNEGRAVRVAGMDYVQIPFGSADELTDGVFDEVRKILRDPSRRPLVLHCATSNRVGAVWMPYRVLDEGVPEDDALAESVRAGLRSSAYSQAARDYIDRNR